MMRFEGEDLKKLYKEAFGVELTEITPLQMRFMVCLGKHIRGRCRSNAALNNYLRRNFSHLDFKEVPRPKKFGTGTYMVLEITDKQRKNLPAATEEGDEE